MPGPLVGFGTDIDTDALYRRIVQLERFSQDPLNVAIGGGVIGDETVKMTVGLTRKLRKTAVRATDVFAAATYRQPPSAWTANAAYKQGEVVSNGGNWYQCIVAGTAAAATGPTGTNAAQIVDNTAKWYFMCPALVSTTAQDTPTLSQQAGGTVAGLTNFITAVGNGGTKFKALDALYYTSGGGYLSAYGGTIAIGNEQAAYGNWEFMTDAPKLAIKISDGSYVTSIRILVNDTSVTVGDYPLSTPNLGNAYWVIVDFGAGARHSRKITIVGMSAIQGVSVDPASSVWGAPTQLVKAMWIGDSYAAGAANAGPARLLDRYPDNVAKGLGIGHGMINLSAGGTGWLQVGGGAYNYLDRINASATQLQAASLDIVFLQGTNNDSVFSDAQLSAQYLAVMQRVRVLQPNALIVVVGPWVGTTPTTAARLSSLLKAALASLNDSHTLFLPTLTDTPEGAAWTGGTGNVGAPVGDGNNDAYLYTDNTHLTVQGLYYLGRRAADAIQTLLNV